MIETRQSTEPAHEQPAVIVLDFSQNPLRVPQTADSSLQTAISETSKVVPMVVGEGSLSEDEILKVMREAKCLHFVSAALVKQTYLENG